MRLFHRKGHGVWSLAGLVALTAAAGAACDAEWITNPREPRSVVFISTLDQDDSWVLLTRLRIVTPAGESNAVIASEEPYGDSGPAGRWTITAEPPEGWAVDPSQEHPLRLDVPPDTTLSVVIRLVETAPAEATRAQRRPIPAAAPSTRREPRLR